MPAAIAPLIDKSAQPAATNEAFKAAAFYSISNCEPGLRGVSLGNFLIKRVAEELKRELPKLSTFCTLSPIPGFLRWLGRGKAIEELESRAMLKPDQRAAFAAAYSLLRRLCNGDFKMLGAAEGIDGADILDDDAHDALLRLCAGYLALLSPGASGDPVARFHLDNGARLERINARADLSPNGLRQSAGMMVKYLYDLDRIEVNHEQFKNGIVVHSRAIAALL
jgi:malonyl-CoA decarboxylase